jgi:hypothetical protein
MNAKYTRDAVANIRAFDFRWLGPPAALALALVGCSPSASAPTSPTPTITVAPSPSPTSTPEPKWVVEESAQGRFSLALPPKWKRIELDAQAWDRAANAIDDPQVKAIFGAQFPALAASGAVFVAFDFTPERVTSGFVTNLNIIRSRLGGTYSLDFIVQVSAGQLEALDSVAKPVEHVRVTLPVGPAEHFKYTINTKRSTGAALSYNVIQYVLVDGTDEYILTFSCSPTWAETYAPVFDRIAQTFTLAR